MTETNTNDTNAASAYSILPSTGPYDTKIGAALITLVEPHVGHERAYNRWYEDDHFYSGAMAMPWMFAGRRWVATADHQALRYPEPSAIADPAEAPHAILSFADPAAGDDVSFYLAATRRFPGVRWIVIAPPRPHPSSNSISSAPSATCSPTA